MGERIGEKMSTWRFPGVLQRIGVCYLVAGLIWLKTTRRAQIAITAALLFGYWILSTVVPVPGSGLLGAATLDRPSETLAAWLDRAVFGAHVWSQSKTWDPEGLLSTLPAIATVFLGIFAGELIGSRKPLSERLSELFAWGVGWTIAGAVWGWFFPINKNLWTSSFTLFTAGLGALVLGLCIWMIEVRGWKGKWTTPFIVFGVNPILAYVGAGLMAKLIYSIIRVPWNGGTISLQAAIYQTAFLSWLPPKAASLAFAISFVLVWLAILWPLWKKGVYVKV
ncbi:MAG TPA: DUF5009 domain-containing protein, partial [Thermoanaerobaculia bacterium]|nr:DUF5009 domain-containing protein [Thermoanaerobaculia bacterium]